MLPLTAALLLVAGLPVRAADPVSVYFSGVSPYTSLSIYRSGGSTLTASAGLMNVELDGDAEDAFCVDLDHGISPGMTYEAMLVEMTEDDPWCAVNAILSTADWSDGTSAAAVQVALWKLVEPGLTVSDATVEALAEDLVAAAEGVCPLTCFDEVEVEGAVHPSVDGLLYVDLSFWRDGGPAIAGEEVLVTLSDGSVIDSDGVTDADGHLGLVIDPDGATGVEILLSMEGSTVYRIEPTETDTQLLAFIGDECVVGSSLDWEDPGLGDPRTIGFWKHQVAAATGVIIGRRHIPAEVLEGWLPLRTFDIEITDLDDLYDVLWTDRVRMRYRALQQCTALQLNVAWEQAGWFTWVDLDGDGDMYPEQQLFELWAEAETAYYDGDFELAKDLCDLFNNL